MYRIRNKQGKIVPVMGLSYFYSYEEARQAIRKRIRAMVRNKKLPLGKTKWTPKLGFFDNKSRNPCIITNVGLQIVRA